MMRKILLALIVFVSLEGMSQSNIRMTNYWDNAYQVNPASVMRRKYLAEVSVAYRNQWVGVEGAPKTLLATATTYLESMNSQFGLKVIQDEIGYTSLTDVSLSYSYVLDLDNWMLNFGLGGTVSSFGYDKSKINLGSIADPTVYNSIENKTTIDSDLGFEANTQNFKVGMVIQKMFNVFSASPAGQFYRNENANFLYVLYRSNTDKLFNFGYGITGIQNVNLYQIEGNLTTFIKYDYDTDPLQLGISLRTGYQFGAHLGMYIDDNLKLLYSYDVNFGAIGNQSKGTHEVMIRYRIDRNNQWGHRNYWENHDVNFY